MSKQNKDAVENAWRIHDAQSDWTGKVDAKASFSFGIQTAIIAAVVALVADDKLYDNFRGWWVLIFIAGIVALSAGAVLAALVVAPLLRGKNLKAESRHDFIYFGHLKHLSATDVENRLRNQDLLPVLSRQVVRMADIAWKKHLKVKWSIWCGVMGGAILVVCGLLIETDFTR